jgi:hypothetical protein
MFGLTLMFLSRVTARKFSAEISIPTGDRTKITRKVPVRSPHFLLKVTTPDLLLC